MVGRVDIDSRALALMSCGLEVGGGSRDYKVWVRVRVPDVRRLVGVARCALNLPCSTRLWQM